MQTINERKVATILYAKKGGLGISKNYRGITLHATPTKLYNTQLLEIEKILGKNQNSFKKNRSTISQFMTIRRTIGKVRAKNLEAALLLEDFSKAFDFIHRVKQSTCVLKLSPL